MNTNLLNNYLKDYFCLINPKITNPTKNLFKCPFNCSNDNTAQIIENTITCLTPGCKGINNIFDYVKFSKPSFKNQSDENIADYLQQVLKIKIEDNINELLNRYYDAGFYLFPLSAGSKIPIKGCNWKDEAVKNIEVWKGYLERGYGLGLKLGRDSNVIAIDIDSIDTYNKIKDILGDTLRQKTKRGAGHFLYNYESDFDLINHDNLRNKGYEMELRANNAYIVIAPSSVEGEIRTWNNKKIINMPLELKNFLLNNINKENSQKTEDDKIQQAIDNEKIDDIDLSGKRNDTFVKLAGIFRKKMNEDQTEFALSVISNTLIDKPIPVRELKAIIGQVKKYRTYDKQELAKTVLERLDIIKEGSAFQISKTLNLAQKDIEEVLAYLENEGKILCVGKNRYKKLNEIEWSDNLTDESQPINFSMPFFNKYAYLNWREIIIIGAISGSGKTILGANIVKDLNKQNIIPYILSTESTSTLGKTFHKLNIQPGQYKYKVVNNVLEVDLPSNAVIILDWLSVKDGEFAKIASIYEHLYSQVKRKNSFLIVFEQLKRDGTFFAQNLNLFYCSLAATYHYGDNGKDYKHTFFSTHKIRDSKSHLSFITIPTIYNPDTREVKLKE